MRKKKQMKNSLLISTIVKGITSMRLYLKDGNTLEFDSNTKLELLNSNEFKEAIQSITEPPVIGNKIGAISSLRYILVNNNNEYLGESIADFTRRPIISNTIDDNSPYIVQLLDWCLDKDKDMYYEINIIKK